MSFRRHLLPLARLYWRLTRPMTLGVRVIATNDDGHILLVRHSYIQGWFLPGGGVEKGETAVQAAERELAEEAGLDATGALSLISVHANFKEFKSDHVFLFRAERWGPCPAKLNGEILETGWFDPIALPPATSPATRARLAEHLHGHPASPHW
jgi:8-oxo-dGTP pyrophosphatase MutT (NUDIX family)